MYTQNPPASPQDQDRGQAQMSQQPVYYGGPPNQQGAKEAMERNVLTALRILAWVSLGVGVLSALMLCGIGAVEMGDWNRVSAASQNLGTYMFLKNIAFGLAITVMSAVLWAVCMALATIMENVMRTRGRM
jgi:hypothetical protein